VSGLIQSVQQTCFLNLLPFSVRMPKKELEESPFKLPASSWTQHILMLNWPCIRFKASTDLPNNPWEGGAIEDFNIVVEVFRVIQKDLERTGRALKKSGGELNNRTRTQGIITLLSELAIPNDPRDNGEGSTIFKESVEPPEQVSLYRPLKRCHCLWLLLELF
jgi:hypothetical protein